jgi:NADPH-dependent 2,4-dienoyl-CoA reductase/sulfur reductase-like enzyme
VGEKIEQAATMHPIESPPESVVIVGGGAAGNMAAGTLREEGYQGRIVLVSADQSSPYDRPNLSKDYLAGSAPADWLPLHEPQFYDERAIDLVLGAHVTALDAPRREIALQDGRRIGGEAMLLATGADPVRLNLPGGALPHVQYLRTLADCNAIIARLEGVQTVVVVGASFIGLEVAAALITRGLDVHVVAPEVVPMARILGAELGDFIQRLHEEHGAHFHLQQTVDRIDGGSVTLQDRTQIQADLVILGVGVRPSLALATDAGLAIERGVLVNEYLETSAPGIWAAGDIARWPDAYSGQHIRVEHWVVAERQGQTAARNILGRRERFDAVPFFWSQHYDVPINYVGHAEEWDHLDVSGSIQDRDCLVAFRKDRRTLAIASIYRDRESLEAELAMERGDEPALQALVPSSDKA